MVRLASMAYHRRNSYTVEFKILVVEWLHKNDHNIHKAAREFNIGRKLVREWEKKYNELLRMNVGANSKRRRLNSGRTPLSVELDQQVFEFLEEERSEGRPVTNTTLQAKAVQIAAGLGLSTFRASSGWLWRWKRRYSVGIRCGTNNSQKVSADYADQIMQFRKTIIAVRKAKKIEPPHIVNMDQTMCRFDMAPARTNNVRGEKTIRIKTTRTEKKGFTVALAAAADGATLPAIIIFKERGGVLGERVRRSLRVPSNVRLRSSTNGWMTATEYQNWLLHVYGKQRERRFLVVDCYKPHKAEESIKMAKERCNANVVIVPGGCTSIIQPMDKCINKPFKESMRQSWQEWMRQDRAKTKQGNLKQPTRQDAINWVSIAWDSISQETIVNSFLVCGISNALDGSEDDYVSDDVPAIELESVEEEEGEEGEDDLEDGTDIDDLGDPFSDDSDVD